MSEDEVCSSSEDDQDRKMPAKLTESERADEDQTTVFQTMALMTANQNVEDNDKETVIQIMRKALPESTKVSTITCQWNSVQCVQISLEAKMDLNKYATEFISFVMSEATDLCFKDAEKNWAKAEKKTKPTVHGDHILEALQKLDFKQYADALRPVLKKEFRDEKTNKTKRKRKQDD